MMNFKFTYTFMRLLEESSWFWRVGHWRWVKLPRHCHVAHGLNGVHRWVGKNRYPLVNWHRPRESPIFMETNLPTPMTARVYVRLLEDELSSFFKKVVWAYVFFWFAKAIVDREMWSLCAPILWGLYDSGCLGSAVLCDGFGNDTEVNSESDTVLGDPYGDLCHHMGSKGSDISWMLWEWKINTACEHGTSWILCTIHIHSKERVWWSLFFVCVLRFWTLLPSSKPRKATTKEGLILS